MLGCRADQVAIINADTDAAPYDTGTFASTGTVVAGQAVALTAAMLRENILDYASRHSRVERAACRLEADSVLCGNQRITLAALLAAGTAEAHRFEAKRRAVSHAPHRRLQRAGHASRGASCHRRSPHSAQRARGRYRQADQPDAVPRADRGCHRAWRFGWTLTENMVHDAAGLVVNPSLRNYRIPAFADTPSSEVMFADTYDRIGPLGAKSQGECAINPVAPAIANALAMPPACASRTYR